MRSDKVGGMIYGETTSRPCPEILFHAYILFIRKHFWNDDMLLRHLTGPRDLTSFRVDESRHAFIGFTISMIALYARRELTAGSTLVIWGKCTLFMARFSIPRFVWDGQVASYKTTGLSHLTSTLFFPAVSGSSVSNPSFFQSFRVTGIHRTPKNELSSSLH